MQKANPARTRLTYVTTQIMLVPLSIGEGAGGCPISGVSDQLFSGRQVWGMRDFAHYSVGRTWVRRECISGVNFASTADVIKPAESKLRTSTRSLSPIHLDELRDWDHHHFLSGDGLWFRTNWRSRGRVASILAGKGQLNGVFVGVCVAVRRTAAIQVPALARRARCVPSPRVAPVNRRPQLS
jgi:hypothetical protein